MFYDYKSYTCHYNAMSLLSGLCQSYRFEKSQPDELTKPKSTRRTLIRPIFFVGGGEGAPGMPNIPKLSPLKPNEKKQQRFTYYFFNMIVFIKENKFLSCLQRVIYHTYLSPNLMVKQSHTGGWH